MQKSEYTMHTIARIHTDFPSKFGIPRQSGLVPELRGKIIFEPAFRTPEALRGLEGFSHIWLFWAFSEVESHQWSPTVRPPRLGGNARMGVFATRSPNRPNPIGLSCVSLSSIELQSPDGPVLHVCGADLMDGTPIFDIKPYLPHADCIPSATGGFATPHAHDEKRVIIPEEIENTLPLSIRDPLRAVLAQDPRPQYQQNPTRIYGFPFAGYEVRFRAEDDVITVVSAEPFSAEAL